MDVDTGTRRPPANLSNDSNQSREISSGPPPSSRADDSGDDEIGPAPMQAPRGTKRVDERVYGGSLTDAFLETVKDRRSIYALAAESPIPDSKIEEIVKYAVTWAPSTYNVQSARAVILFKENHQKFWDIAKTHMAAIPLPDGMRAYMDGRIAGWRASYGTVLWFEDQVALDGLAAKNPMIGPMLTEWSDHSTGIHQFIGKNTSIRMISFSASCT